MSLTTCLDVEISCPYPVPTPAAHSLVTILTELSRLTYFKVV